MLLFETEGAFPEKQKKTKTSTQKLQMRKEEQKVNLLSYNIHYTNAYIRQEKLSWENRKHALNKKHTHYSI